MSSLSSRERMLAALSCDKPDYVPCCFMIFKALRDRCANDFEIFDMQLDLGLDVRVELPEIPARFDSGVTTHTWKEKADNQSVSLLRKEHRTPSGTLTAVVRQTADWIHGDDVPLFDDYVAPRSVKFRVTGPEDLAALRHLLVSPSDDAIASFRQSAEKYRRYARRKGLLLCGGWRPWLANPEHLLGNEGSAMVGIDALMWLCGATAPLYWAYDQPQFLEELIDIISVWDRRLMEIYLDVGAELIVERAWYSSADYWSPNLYRKFIVPVLRDKVDRTHEAGAKFGYIMTTGSKPLLDEILELNIDVLIGVDPLQDTTMDLSALARRAGDRMCLWGGVNAPLCVQSGTPAEIWAAVEEAIATCGRRGGFVLSPVDNIEDTSQETWENVLEFIEAWRHFGRVSG